MGLDMKNSNRAVRYNGRAALRTITHVSRCYDCGRETHATDGVVGIRQTADNIVGFSGLVSCGRIWLCPVCNAKVMARRSTELGAMLAWAAGEGLHVIWGSLTMRHNTKTRLSSMIPVEQAAWRSVMMSKPWTKASATKRIDHSHTPECQAKARRTTGSSCQRQYDTIDTGRDGRVGYVRAAELNIGPNGWHPHFHPIILFRGTIAQAAAFAQDVVKLWLSGVCGNGGDALEEGAQQLRVLAADESFSELGNYVTKATYDSSTLALEAVWSQSKDGSGRAAGTTAHWTILAGIEQGLAHEADRWLELEEATHGHRMLTWSRGLRDFAGLTDEISDEDIAAEEAGTDQDTVAVITPRGWRHVRDTPEALSGILDALEEAGTEAMLAVLHLYGVEYVGMEDLYDTASDFHDDNWQDHRDDEARTRWLGDDQPVEPAAVLVQEQMIHGPFTEAESRSSR